MPLYIPRRLNSAGGGKGKLEHVFPLDRHLKCVVAMRGHDRNHRLTFGVLEANDVAVLTGRILPECGQRQGIQNNCQCYRSHIIFLRIEIPLFRAATSPLRGGGRIGSIAHTRSGGKVSNGQETGNLKSRVTIVGNRPGVALTLREQPWANWTRPHPLAWPSRASTSPNSFRCFQNGSKSCQKSFSRFWVVRGSPQTLDFGLVRAMTRRTKRLGSG